ncbi:MAG: hypothetical protein WCK90_03820 [archaeon]
MTVRNYILAITFGSLLGAGATYYKMRPDPNAQQIAKILDLSKSIDSMLLEDAPNLADILLMNKNREMRGLLGECDQIMDENNCPKPFGMDKYLPKKEEPETRERIRL